MNNDHPQANGNGHRPEHQLDRDQRRRDRFSDESEHALHSTATGGVVADRLRCPKCRRECGHFRIVLSSLECYFYADGSADCSSYEYHAVLCEEGCDITEEEIGGVVRAKLDSALTRVPTLVWGDKRADDGTTS
jgi:hypothetical protein